MVRVFRLQTLLCFAAALLLAGCTADPNAPINQVFPIKQMDDFFRPITGSPGPRPAYTERPGYAPAYPPYSTDDGRDASLQSPVTTPGAGVRY